MRLAWGGPPDALAAGLGAVPGSPLPRPALLVSYFYWKNFAAQRARYDFRDYSLDSGAYSAFNSGKAIDLGAYIETARHLLATDKQCTEVFSLDVIGDWKGSLSNTEKLWEAGVPAVPVYHMGEPEHVLKHMAKNYPKLSLGGAVGVTSKRKTAWAKQCFARIWPARVHGLSFGSEDAIMALPFHSVDATNWEIGPCAFGRWASYNGNLSVRGGKQNLRVEVEHYLRVEQRAKIKWRKQMEELESDGPTLRLVAAHNKDNYRFVNALGPSEGTQ